MPQLPKQYASRKNNMLRSRKQYASPIINMLRSTKKYTLTATDPKQQGGSTHLGVYCPGGLHSWGSTLLGVYTVSGYGFGI